MRVAPAGDSRPTALAVALDVEARLRADHPEVVAAVSTEFGRKVIGALLGRTGLGAVADVLDIEPSADGAFGWVKAGFGRGLLATIRCRTRPVLVTVRPGVFASNSVAAPVRIIPEPNPEPVPKLDAVRITSFSPSERAPGPPLPGARVVVVVGMGVGGPEGVAAVASHLPRLGAALGGTRKVVDAGWLPVDRQVGLTGASLAPDLAVLLGVSGSVNHLVGLRRVGVLLAINSDRSARVFSEVDLGLVGDWKEIFPRLVEALSAGA